MRELFERDPRLGIEGCREVTGVCPVSRQIHLCPRSRRPRMSDSPRQMVRRWLADRAPEGQHLEFKRLLQLSDRRSRREALKDLTAMGNGGGGTIAFGIAES